MFVHISNFSVGLSQGHFQGVESHIYLEMRIRCSQLSICCMSEPLTELNRIHRTYCFHSSTRNFMFMYKPMVTSLHKLFLSIEKEDVFLIHLRKLEDSLSNFYFYRLHFDLLYTNGFQVFVSMAVHDVDSHHSCNHACTQGNDVCLIPPFFIPPLISLYII